MKIIDSFMNTGVFSGSIIKENFDDPSDIVLLKEDSDNISSQFIITEFPNRIEMMSRFEDVDLNISIKIHHDVSEVNNNPDKFVENFIKLDNILQGNNKKLENLSHYIKEIKDTINITEVSENKFINLLKPIWFSFDSKNYKDIKNEFEEYLTLNNISLDDFLQKNIEKSYISRDEKIKLLQYIDQYTRDAFNGDNTHLPYITALNDNIITTLLLSSENKTKQLLPFLFMNDQNNIETLLEAEPEFKKLIKKNKSELTM